MAQRRQMGRACWERIGARRVVAASDVCGGVPDEREEVSQKVPTAVARVIVVRVARAVPGRGHRVPVEKGLGAYGDLQEAEHLHRVREVWGSRGGAPVRSRLRLRRE